LDTETTKATSRDCNNEIYQMTQTWPDRFAGLATLPMQDVNAAVAELERVMTQMNFKGAMIDDKINGVTLDHSDYMPFWKAAEEMGALILFHQTGETVVNSRINRYHLPNTIGNLADRTITFASLVLAELWTHALTLRYVYRMGAVIPVMGSEDWIEDGQFDRKRE